MSIEFTYTRCVSVSKIRVRVNEVTRRKIFIFFFDQLGHNSFDEYLGSERWCAKLAYLAEFLDTWTVIISIQGRNENIITSDENHSLFKKSV